MILDTIHQTKLNSTFTRYFTLGAIAVLLSRLFSMALIPLNDTTEARYGEIARKMLETGNWVTPLHDYGVPFWAKPPLSSWLSATSMAGLGVNAFAARLPSLFLALAVLYLVYQLGKDMAGQMMGLAASLILASSLFFLLDAGVVMTDPALVFCTTLIAVSFWQAVANEKNQYRYPFFIACGLGLLAKGPIALVLAGLPVFFWTLIFNQWSALWKKLPWIKGSLLTLGIALPWYLLAEQRTPGFLHYFFVGEHYLRFTQPAWQGDKYGFAHLQPKGMIWLYLIAGLFPWSLASLAFMAKKRGQLFRPLKRHGRFLSYLLLWALLPLCFFTFARNTLYTYSFASLPPMALIYAHFWYALRHLNDNGRTLFILAMISASLFFIASACFFYRPLSVQATQKPVAQAFLALRPQGDSALIYWDSRKPFSAAFYTHGRVNAFSAWPNIIEHLQQYPQDLLALSEQQLARLSVKQRNALYEITRVKTKAKQYRALMRLA